MTPKFQVLVRALALVGPLCLAGAAGAEVQTYFYSGNAFTIATAGFGLTHVSIRADIDMSRVQANSHVVVDSYNSGGLLAYSFSDGYNNITNNPFDGFAVYSSASISFDTAADRSIVGNWQAIASRAHGSAEGLILNDSIGTTNLPTGAPYGQGMVVDTASSLVGYTASVTNNSGRWSTMPSVPEPPAALLAILGMTLLALLDKHRAGWSASPVQ